MTLIVTITDAGRAEVINAQNTGTGPVQITHMAFGTAQYNPAANATTLQAEAKRVAITGGSAVSADTIHVVGQDSTTDDYTVGEVGLFSNSGTLFAIYSQTSDPIVQKSAAATLIFGIDIILTTLNAASVTFGDIVFVAPPATTTVAGIVELATNAETIAGDDDQRAVTSAGLASLTATGTRRGLVQLSNSTNNSSTSIAATAGAVKSANDNANTRAPSSRTVSAGNGLSGGGNLTTNRTITLGTPETITDTSTNSVSSTGHSHLIDEASTSKRGIVQLANTVSSTLTNQAATAAAVKSANDNANTRAPSSRTISAGNGLSGGGNLTTNRTITLGTPETITDASTNSVSTSGHSHAVDHASTSARGIVQLSTSTSSTSTSVAATSSAVKAANDNANGRVPSGRSISAGNGLTGGGNLSANRSISLGTPGQITDASTNSVSASGHTHAIDHASTSARGIVELATSTEAITGTDTIRAITSAALHAKTASTSRIGLVQLTSSTGSTSTSLAATASAVKAANDNANNRINESQLKSSRTPVLLKSGNFVNGANTLSEAWNLFEELIVVTGSATISNSVHSHHLFLTDAFVPDDTAPFNRNIMTTSSATEIAFNVGSSNKKIMYLAGHGDDDIVAKVYGRFRK